MARRGPKARTGRNTKQAPVSGCSVTAPAHLSDVERAEFDRLAAKLDAVGLLSKADVRTIESAARVQTLIERAAAQLSGLDDEGQPVRLTETAANGTLMPHPMIGVVRQLTEQHNRLMNTLGLTPASSKMQTKSPDAEKVDDPWAGMGLGVVG
jgi:P27 family predicted phage terminase small subunit